MTIIILAIIGVLAVTIGLFLFFTHNVAGTGDEQGDVGSKTTCLSHDK